MVSSSFTCSSSPSPADSAPEESLSEEEESSCSTSLMASSWRNNEKERSLDVTRSSGHSLHDGQRSVQIPMTPEERHPFEHGVYAL
ncbi:hypothetical protein EYF80_039622 [Liparis tanakae]|uniref:Uncharacterized protein n=1 Tax=Liparis tanakae TaxID=230148 RepID=A0A4Z2G9K9_9TELE|nr:hypothetical protein EYF80_039622 [Liparis tanakae]